MNAQTPEDSLQGALLGHEAATGLHGRIPLSLFDQPALRDLCNGSEATAASTEPAPHLHQTPAMS